MIEYRIYEEVYNDMVSKKKNVEIRLLNEKSSKIKIGDIIKFKVIDNNNKYIEVKVIDLIIYENIEELWKNRSFNLLSSINTFDEFKDLFYSIYKKEDVDTHKIIGIKFELI